MNQSTSQSGPITDQRANPEVGSSGSRTGNPVQRGTGSSRGFTPRDPYNQFQTMGISKTIGRDLMIDSARSRTPGRY